jgi:integrase
MKRTRIIRGLTKHLLRTTAIEVLEDGKGKPGRHADGCNLFARVSTARTRRAMWVFAYKRAGAKSATEITLGPVKVKTVPEVRKRAADMFEALQAGGDPQADIAAEAAKADSVRTVKAIVDKFLADSVGKRNTKTQAAAVSALERYLRPIANVDHEKVTANQIEDTLRPIMMAKPVEGRVAAQRLVAAFKHSGRPDNPAEVAFDRLRVTLPAHRATEKAALPRADLPGFWARLAAIDHPAARCLQFQILTGARPSEARQIERSEIDHQQAVWTLPAVRSKTKVPVERPLSKAALALLDDAERPFPVGEKAVIRLMRDLGVCVSAHGFRACLRNWADDAAIEFEVAERMLGHKIGSTTTRAYLRGAALERQRAAFEAWSKFLQADKTANVVPIRA